MLRQPASCELLLLIIINHVSFKQGPIFITSSLSPNRRIHSSFLAMQSLTTPFLSAAQKTFHWNLVLRANHWFRKTLVQGQENHMGNKCSPLLPFEIHVHKAFPSCLPTLEGAQHGMHGWDWRGHSASCAGGSGGHSTSHTQAGPVVLSNSCHKRRGRVLENCFAYFSPEFRRTQCEKDTVGILRCLDFFAVCHAFVFGPQSYKQ